MNSSYKGPQVVIAKGEFRILLITICLILCFHFIVWPLIQGKEQESPQLESTTVMTTFDNVEQMVDDAIESTTAKGIEEVEKSVSNVLKVTDSDFEAGAKRDDGNVVNATSGYPSN